MANLSILKKFQWRQRLERYSLQSAEHNDVETESYLGSAFKDTYSTHTFNKERGYFCADIIGQNPLKDLMFMKSRYETCGQNSQTWVTHCG